MIHIVGNIAIPEKQLQWQFVRASGPGGQNVNKVSTAVELRFDVGASALPCEVKRRLRGLAGERLTSEGILIIQAQRFRSQVRNREDALQRFVDLLRAAAQRPKLRRPTAPSAAARRKRVDAKKKRGAIKARRATVREFD